MQKAKCLTSPAHEDCGGHHDIAHGHGLSVAECNLGPSQSH